MTAFIAVLTAHLLDPARIILTLIGFWASLQMQGAARWAAVAVAIVVIAFVVAALLNARYFIDSLVFGLISNAILMAVAFGIRQIVIRRRSS